MRISYTNHAFTLLQTTIVTALIAIIITLSVSNFAFLNRHMVRSEVETFYTLCRFAQQRALVSNEEQTIVFDEKNQSYEYLGNRHVLPPQVLFGFLSEATGPPSKPNKKINKAITFADNQIVFYSDGSIQSGSLYFIDASKQYMYGLTIPVASNSFIRKYRYDGAWHQIS